MKRKTGNYIVLILSVSLLWLTLSFLVYRSLNNTDRNFIYATDDNYIFMAMAKNLSGQGHWSADAKSFSSSSSSHLWLVILSTAFLLFGTNQLIPFAINLIAGTFLIYLLWRFFRSYSLSPVYVLVIMTAIILCTPLTSVILTGWDSYPCSFTD
ncbi:MAG: hypothetical protein IPG99_16225 [Ignavibacteria bacterium]|nr:hypothetical protein [Ignavibacteria bacterium]